MKEWYRCDRYRVIEDTDHGYVGLIFSSFGFYFRVCGLKLYKIIILTRVMSNITTLNGNCGNNDDARYDRVKLRGQSDSSGLGDRVVYLYSSEDPDNQKNTEYA